MHVCTHVCTHVYHVYMHVRTLLKPAEAGSTHTAIWVVVDSIWHLMAVINSIPSPIARFIAPALAPYQPCSPPSDKLHAVDGANRSIALFEPER